MAVQAENLINRLTINPLKYLNNLPEFYGDSGDLQTFTTLIDRVHSHLQTYDEIIILEIDVPVKNSLVNYAANPGDLEQAMDILFQAGYAHVGNNKGNGPEFKLIRVIGIITTEIVHNTIGEIRLPTTPTIPTTIPTTPTIPTTIPTTPIIPTTIPTTPTIPTTIPTTPPIPQVNPQNHNQNPSFQGPNPRNKPEP
ncbi:unnamed protein product [Ceratitis capitata]|uniref:(Mediterranean fruit fly) hypothetical protein n=1 Tax=Ceratitis capitata TaxID=7213 RepID=A0A811UYH3_CERCA|nr:unnamed protein product [Ceratitis capitata]